MVAKIEIETIKTSKFCILFCLIVSFCLLFGALRPLFYKSGGGKILGGGHSALATRCNHRLPAITPTEIGEWFLRVAVTRRGRAQGVASQPQGCLIMILANKVLKPMKNDTEIFRPGETQNKIVRGRGLMAGQPLPGVAWRGVAGAVHPRGNRAIGEDPSQGVKSCASNGRPGEKPLFAAVSLHPFCPPHLRYLFLANNFFHKKPSSYVNKRQTVSADPNAMRLALAGVCDSQFGTGSTRHQVWGSCGRLAFSMNIVLVVRY